MTNQPLNAAALRGAVDLSSLKKPAAAPGGTNSMAGAPAAPGATPEASAPTSGAAIPGDNGNGLVVEATTENFSSYVQQSMSHPVIITVWASSQPASATPVQVLAQAVHKQEGRVLLAVADIETSPEVAQFFAQLSQQAAAQGQAQQVLAAAFVQGQPIPIPPVMEQPAADEILEQIAQIALQNGLSGRVASYNPNAAEGGEAPAEPELPALHKVAYDAIDNGDLDGAMAAFEQAIKENPNDDDARIALGQVKLMKRTQGADLQAARAAAAADASDIEAQMMMADLDLLGGHVEDAFGRLIDTVKATSGDERNTVREHLIELFDVVGSSDPRVKKARMALMSALY